MHRSARWFLAALTILAVVTIAMPIASAVEAASPVQRAILELFFIILILSLVIGVLVHVVLLLAVKWYRDVPGRRAPEGKVSTHNRKLEVGWTIGPVVILAAVAILTIAALPAIERPSAYDYTITVVGAQWVWLFEYPDWNGTVTDIKSSGNMYIEQGKTFLLEVRSLDVIHSFYVPDLGIKIDAVPGITNTFWVRADRAGTYTVNCAEFCGDGHSQMNGAVVVFPEGSQEVPYGPPPSPAPPPISGDLGFIVPVEFRESPGPYGEWSIVPSRLRFGQGIKVTLQVWNNETAVHQFRMAAPYDLTGPVQDADGPPALITFWTNTTTPGIEFWCDIAGHLELGMRAILNVTGPRDQEILLTPAGIQPKLVSIGPGQTLNITVSNLDSVPHDFSVGGAYGISLGPIAAGGSVSRTIQFNLTTVGSIGDESDIRFLGELIVSPVGAVEAPPPPPAGFPVLEVTFALVGIAGIAAVWLNVKFARDAKRREEMPPEEEFE